MASFKRGSEDGEGSARKKLAGATRTGQACDRCKVRKIRCDVRPGGCSPCLQNNTECKTTDRITGRATSRGHTENLENDNNALRMHVLELQQQLKENGLDPKPAPHPVVSMGYMSEQPKWPGEQQEQRLSSVGAMPGSRATPHSSYSQGAVLPDFRPTCVGDNYLGVSSSNDWLSPIEGTSLTLFGMKIDFAAFSRQDDDDPDSPASYKGFLKHIFDKSFMVEAPPLPSYEHFRTYADWYFKSVQVFIPILHKPDFMALLARVYENNHQTTVHETVQLHMILAIMQFQFSARNGNEEVRQGSLRHYQHSLCLVPELMADHTWQGVQALTLICQLLRALPRPGPAWIFTHMVMGLAVELGLHRSATAWSASPLERDPHVTEMRKRVFWSLMTFHIAIGGKLGRPMPFRFEDIDVEIPEPVFDNLPSEAHLSPWLKCSFRTGIEGMKQMKILMQVYATVYSVNPSKEPYEVSVQRLEKEIQNFRAQLPPELAGGSQTVQQDRTSSLYLQMIEQESRLLLHHPSLCRTASPQVSSNNLDICLSASDKLLGIAMQLRNLKALDTTWYQNTTLLAAIFTTLFIHTQRQDHISAVEIQKLKSDMDEWLEVMGSIGEMIGSGQSLREAIKRTVDHSLSTIDRHLAKKTASASLATVDSSAAVRPSQHLPQQQLPSNASEWSTSYPNTPSHLYPPGVHSNDNGNRLPNAIPPNYQLTPPPQQRMPQHLNTWTDIAPTTDAHPPYPPQDIKPQLDDPHHLNPSPFQPTQQQMPQPLPHSQPQTPAPYLPPFQPPPHPNSYGYNMPATSMPPPAAWRHFTDAMMMHSGGVGNGNGNGFVYAAPDDSNGSGAPHASGAPRAGAPGVDLGHVPGMGVGGAGASAGALPLGGAQGEGAQTTWPLLTFQGGPMGGR